MRLKEGGLFKPVSLARVVAGSAARGSTYRPSSRRCFASRGTFGEIRPSPTLALRATFQSPTALTAPLLPREETRDPGKSDQPSGNYQEIPLPFSILTWKREILRVLGLFYLIAQGQKPNNTASLST